MLDVCPDSFKHLPGFQEAVNERAKVPPAVHSSSAGTVSSADMCLMPLSARQHLLLPELQWWRLRVCAVSEASIRVPQVRDILMARPPGEFQTMGRRIWNEPGRIGGTPLAACAVQQSSTAHSTHAASPPS